MGGAPVQTLLDASLPTGKFYLSHGKWLLTGRQVTFATWLPPLAHPPPPPTTHRLGRGRGKARRQGEDDVRAATRQAKADILQAADEVRKAAGSTRRAVDESKREVRRARGEAAAAARRARGR